MGAVPVHLRGIGGPGAPHVFRFQRRGEAGVDSFLSAEPTVLSLLECNQALKVRQLLDPGLDRSQIADKFFKLKLGEEHPNDVILRLLVCFNAATLNS